MTRQEYRLRRFMHGLAVVVAVVAVGLMLTFRLSVDTKVWIVVAAVPVIFILVHTAPGCIGVHSDVTRIEMDSEAQEPPDRLRLRPFEPDDTRPRRKG